MFATLADKLGNRVEVEILESSERNIYREATIEAEAVMFKTLTLESPLPVRTPDTFQLEREDGAIDEATVVVCELLPSGRYFLLAVRRIASPSLALI